MGTFDYTGQVQIVTVAATGEYDIIALGASGGNGPDGQAGGLGAEEAGRFELTAGEKLEIVVGGVGGTAPTNSTGGAGGGGGSFVFANTGPGGSYVPLLVAGGGGGSFALVSGGAGTTEAPGDGFGGAPGSGNHGTSYAGGGGAGVLTDGLNANLAKSGGYGGSAAPTFKGGAGGGGTPAGGFGGGGGGGGDDGGAGGGGGYSGGNGGYGFSAAAAAQGGTSFDAGTPITAHTLDGVNNGDGKVEIPGITTCFAAGTLIRTKRGDTAVESLAVGDRVVTASGEERPIRWLGHRTIDCRAHPRPHEVMPIRIAAHSFFSDCPARDLFVSPGHAICVDVVGEVLISAGTLVNGSTVQQVEVDEITYWHVELESHDIILAENLPTESYLDMGNRGFFADGDVIDLDASPDADPSQRTHADFCRPFHAAGALVEVVRAQLQKRAEASGWTLTSALELHLEVDGRRVDPLVRDLTVRFHVPAGAEDVWLVSPTARPCDAVGTGDGRDLGVNIAALRIDDGFEARNVAMDDPLLGIGFHGVEEGCRRWTSGRARLPAALWEGCEDGFFLRVELAGLPVPRWTAPAAGSAATSPPRLAIVA